MRTKIELIKEVRLVSGCMLKEAKDIVEHLEKIGEIKVVAAFENDLNAITSDEAVRQKRDDIARDVMLKMIEAGSYSGFDNRCILIADRAFEYGDAFIARSKK